MKHLLTMLSYKASRTSNRGRWRRNTVIEVDSAKSLEQLPEKGGIPCAIVPRTETQRGIAQDKTTRLAVKAVQEVVENNVSTRWLNNVREPSRAAMLKPGTSPDRKTLFSTDQLVR